LNEIAAMTEVTVSLPDDIAQQARQAGLLRSETLAALLRDAMRQGRIERLFANMDKLSKIEPSLTEEEIAAEIDAARAERRARKS
jgi:hypothetical protein